MGAIGTLSVFTRGTVEKWHRKAAGAGLLNGLDVENKQYRKLRLRLCS